MEALFLENYWIKKELGRGNISIVYEAVNSITGKNIVLKRFLLPPLLLESQRKDKFNVYKAELERYFTLQQPSITETYSFFEENKEFYLEMELLEGKSLSDIIAQDIPFKLDEGVHVFLKAAEALAYAHKQGMYHRYLKPSNIFVCDDGDIKITDFGTFIFNRDEKEKDITSDKAPPRFYDYFSPEQLRGEEFDARCDVYSLAAAMYHLFTGKPPFEGDTPEDLRKKILEQEVEPPSVLNPNIPELLNYMLIKALNKNPDLRHRDMDDLVRDIKHLFQSGSISGVGIRAGHIHRAKGRISFTFRNFKQQVVDIFSKLTGKKGDKPEGEEAAGEKKNIKTARPPVPDIDIEIPTEFLQNSAPRMISSRVEDVPTTTPILPRTKKRDYSSLLFAVAVTLGVMVFLFFVARVVIGVKNYREANPGNDVPVESSPTFTAAEVPIDKNAPNTGTDTDGKSKGTVSISVNVPDAIIFIQNYYDHSIPPIQQRTGSNGYINDFNLSPGVYSLRIEKEMCRPYERRIEIMAGQRNNVKATLERKEPRLQVFTNPGGASVLLNGSLYGNTPLTLYEVRYGNYKLKIQKKGYESVTSDVQIKPSSPVIINRDLEPVRKAGSRIKKIVKQIKESRSFITVVTTPPGAVVYLDNKRMGVTPIKKLRLKPGTYTIVLKKDGYREGKHKITVPRGLMRDFYFDLAHQPGKGNVASDTIPRPDSHSSPYYPTEKPDYSKVEKRLPKAEETPKKDKKVNLVVKLRFIPGVAYDKLDRRIITISFDAATIQRNLEKMLEKQKHIQLSDSGFTADMMLKLHFAVGINTEGASRKPKLTLYSAVMISDFRTKSVLYHKTDETPLEFPEGTSLEAESDGGSIHHSNRFLNTDKTTPEVNLFIEKKLARILEEMKDYDPDKMNFREDPGEHSGKQPGGEPVDYTPGVPPDEVMDNMKY